MANNRYTKKQLEDGRAKLHRATTRRRTTPLMWASFVKHAQFLAENEQHISLQALAGSVRKKSFVDSFGNDSRINNDHLPIFARWLVNEHPETAPYIELRRSVFDEIDVTYREPR